MADSPKEEQEQTAGLDETQAAHARLQGDVDDLEAQRDYFLSNAGQDVKDRLERICKKRERDYELLLRHCKPSSTARNQGCADSFAEMALVVTGLAWDEEIEVAQARLSNFETDNALLLFPRDGENQPEPEPGGHTIALTLSRVATEKDRTLLEKMGFSMTGASAASAKYSAALDGRIKAVCNGKSDLIHEIRYTDEETA